MSDSAKNNLINQILLKTAQNLKAKWSYREIRTLYDTEIRTSFVRYSYIIYTEICSLYDPIKNLSGNVH